MSRFNQQEIRTRLQDEIVLMEARFIRVWQSFARDAQKLARLQTAILALLVLWALSSLSQLFWAPWRVLSLDSMPTEMMNVPRPTSGVGQLAIDVTPVLGSGIFGDNPDAPVEAEAAGDAAGGREGIEQDAKETRLALVLTGIVASTDDGLGSAVIKGGNREQVYAVGDQLPVSGKVTLAKVMPRQVVIDNAGTYELIKLYEGPGLVVPTRATGASRPETAMRTRPQPLEEAAADPDTRARMAGLYRQQLYDAPETLAQVVSIAPVRDGGSVTGYRVMPGADRAAFDATGFKSGDVVTAVNGLALSDASNTLKLYQMMKDADQATFELDRNGESVTLSVDLASP
ncbi:MAG: type II secretion system protein GspC [Halieaceae bacterium]